MRSKQRLNVAHQATIERESSSALGEALSCRRSTGRRRRYPGCDGSGRYESGANLSFRSLAVRKLRILG
jgi:hypothetical protein